MAFWHNNNNTLKTKSSNNNYIVINDAFTFKAQLAFTDRFIQYTVKIQAVEKVT